MSIASLFSEDPQIRHNSISLLTSQIATSLVKGTDISHLLHLLTLDPDISILLHLLNSLHDLFTLHEVCYPTSIVSPSLGCIPDINTDVRVFVSQDLDHALCDLTLHESPQVRQTTLATLGALLGYATKREVDDENWKPVCEKAFSLIQDALMDLNVRVRMSAVKALGEAESTAKYKLGEGAIRGMVTMYKTNVVEEIVLKVLENYGCRSFKGFVTVDLFLKRELFKTRGNVSRERLEIARGRVYRRNRDFGRVCDLFAQAGEKMSVDEQI